MAIITPAVLQALNTAIKKSFSDKYEQMKADSFYNTVATVMPSSTTMNTYAWLSDFPKLREWIGERLVKDMAVKPYQMINKLFESTVGVKRTDIEDDQYGHYALRAQHMGQAAAEHPDILVSDAMKAGTTELCYDGQNFFDTDHPVYPNEDGTGVAATVSNYQAGALPGWFLLDTRGVLKPFIFQERTKPELESQIDPKTSEVTWRNDQYEYGIRYRCVAGYGFWQTAYFSKMALNEENFEAAMQAMMEFTADGGRPLGIMPNMLVVPPALRSSASKLIERMNADGGSSNHNYKAVEVKVVPWLAGV